MNPLMKGAMNLRSSYGLCRFATAIPKEQVEKVKKFNQDKIIWKKQMTQLRKEYAEEWKQIDEQMKQIREEKIKANYRAKKITPEELKQKKEEHQKRAWETLNQSQLSRQVRKAKSLVNYRLEMEKHNANVVQYLDSLKPFAENCYSSENVSERLAQEMNSQPLEYSDLFRVTDEALFPSNNEVSDSNKVVEGEEDLSSDKLKAKENLEDLEVNQELEEDSKHVKSVVN